MIIIHTESMQVSPPILETKKIFLLYGRIQIERRIDRNKDAELIMHVIYG